MNNDTPFLVRIIMEYVIRLAIDKFIKNTIFNKRDLFFVLLSILIDVPYFGTCVIIALAYKTEIIQLIDAIHRITDQMDNEIYSIELNGIHVRALKIDILNQNPNTKKLHILIELHVFR